MPPQRRWKRINLDFRVRVSWEENGNMQREVARANTLSAGGIGLFSPIDIPAGTSVELEFSLPGSDRKFHVPARIRDGQGFRYGLEFLNVSDEDRAFLLRACGDKGAG